LAVWIPSKRPTSTISGSSMTALSKRRITSALHSPSPRALTKRSEQDSADVARATDVHIRSVVDEFQNFTTLAVTNMLSELRKYRVGFTIAHQYLHQLEADIRHAVLGNVGSISHSGSARRMRRISCGNSSIDSK
jgi:hypothetical protein